MYFLKSISIFLLLAQFNLLVNAQTIDSAISKFKNALPFEKAYVHFDNTNYSAGQTIWYKAYLLSGFLPSTISKNFYIDWYNDKGKLIKSTITPIIASSSVGSFTLPANYEGKFINAVCYTKWMRNFDSLYFFNQIFPVVSPTTSAEKETGGITETNIQFLAESGIILTNKKNIIAFKAVNNLGFPVEIRGIIRNNIGDSITSFASIHDGMGKFQLLAEIGKTYIAEWKDSFGNIHKTKLPPSQEIGVNIIIEPNKTNRKFYIQRTAETTAEMKNLILVGTMNGAVLIRANINLQDKESITSSIPINRFLTGLLQLTVLNANGKPLCERVIFVKNEDYSFDATILADTIRINKRAKNIFTIRLNDTINANMSISVTDASSNHPPGNTILSQLLLKGELKGNIFNSSYYFSGKSDTIDNYLDLVMLTNGWRKYNWDQIYTAPSRISKYEKDTSYLTIKGSIKDYYAEKNKKTASINLFLLSHDSSSSMLVLPIGEDGSFSRSNMLIYDSTKIFYSTKGLKNTRAEDITITSDLYKTNGDDLQQMINFETDTTGFINKQNIAKQQHIVDSIMLTTNLREVTVFTKELSRTKLLDQKYTTGIFSGAADAAFDMSILQNKSNTQSIFDFLTGKVPDLSVRILDGGTGKITFRGADVNFYLNENRILVSDLNDIEINSIAYIKVFNPPFMGGFNSSGSTAASGGAIVIYTKKGADIVDNQNILKNSGLAFKTITGYAPVKEFYEPNYAEATLANGTADLRTTLLWRPWINLDKSNQSIKLSFYNNDITRSFRFVLEGMDSKGRLIHINKVFK
jgi:hypothetical protein